MNTPSPNPFSTVFLDRRAERRRDPDWAAQALADPDTRFLVARGTTHLVQREPDTRIRFLTASDPIVGGTDAAQLTLLGWHAGRRCVLIDDLSDRDIPPGTVFEELRPLLPLLSADDIGLLAYARGLIVWRGRHRHCGVCGSATAPQSAGHVLRCRDPGCGADFFPRIDPAIIVLVSDGEQVLLGRQASWPVGRYSALAGFVEAGETLEDAVVREVQEETAVGASEVSYFASQAWPFPSSLMLGFHARGRRDVPIVLDGELEDARWFHAEELAAAPPGMLPPPHTIARHLIEAWYANATGRTLS
ncbi:MAG TPA: NAD(+) diphosphatase [Steroidobacteraceae bacterium]|nr:NAD(+) diphosphatase [Steroidobacteraceae bacterium]